MRDYNYDDDDDNLVAKVSNNEFSFNYTSFGCTLKFKYFLNSSEEGYRLVPTLSYVEDHTKIPLASLNNLSSASWTNSTIEIGRQQKSFYVEFRLENDQFGENSNFSLGLGIDEVALEDCQVTWPLNKGCNEDTEFQCEDKVKQTCERLREVAN